MKPPANVTWNALVAVESTARYGWIGKPVATATTVRRDDVDTIAVRYHQTDVVTVHRHRDPETDRIVDVTVTLNTGGYETAATKRRMNQWAPGLRRLYAEAGDWYVVLDGETFDDPTPYGNVDPTEDRLGRLHRYSIGAP